MVRKEIHVQIRVGNHITVNVQPGTHKAMKNAARKIPRRRPPPATAHVLMVKTTVVDQPGERKKHFGCGLAFREAHAQLDHD